MSMQEFVSLCSFVQDTLQRLQAQNSEHRNLDFWRHIVSFLHLEENGSNVMGQGKHKKV